MDFVVCGLRSSGGARAVAVDEVGRECWRRYRVISRLEVRTAHPPRSIQIYRRTIQYGLWIFYSRDGFGSRRSPGCLALVWKMVEKASSGLDGMNFHGDDTLYEYQSSFVYYYPTPLIYCYGE